MMNRMGGVEVWNIRHDGAGNATRRGFSLFPLRPIPRSGRQALDLAFTLFDDVRSADAPGQREHLLVEVQRLRVVGDFLQNRFVPAERLVVGAVKGAL